MLHPGQHIHIVGVGGFGMSAIARVLAQRGYTVSGSDLRANAFTRDLAALGVTVYEGHAADHITGADLLVISSAVPDDNPEVAAARAQGIPVLLRRDMLGELMAGQIGIAIAGTHGKTTTTALLAHTLIEAGLDPTYIVGGVMLNTGTNAGVGRGAPFVIEADEYDRMFLGLRPQIAVVTNIEHDHPDCYPTLGAMLDAFADFVNCLPDDGLLVVCADDPRAAALGAVRRAAGKPVVTYGLTPPPGSLVNDAAGEAGHRLTPTRPLHAMGEANWSAADLHPDPSGGMRFTAHRSGQSLGPVRLNLSGTFNVQNALAVLAVADHLGVRFEQIAAAFESFQGTGRRAEIMGQVGGVTVVSDYAHHPTAIRLTLAAHRDRPGVSHLWAVWQPHTYGRMRALADDFATAFAAADHVLVTDVYSVREDFSPGLDAPGMVDSIRAAGHPDARYTGGLDATARILAEEARPGDWVLILSAGDAPQIGQRLLHAHS
jgi:UDP-N-acetylmuramate--alanine ligase